MTATRSVTAKTRRLDGRVAIVTGGASGIGRAIAERIASEGGSVVVGDLDESALAEVGRLLADRGSAIRCDVTDDEGPTELVRHAIDRFGRLDIAVVNAGGGTAASIVDQSLAEWRRIIDLNLTGAFLTLQAAAREMSDGGAVVVTSSLAAVQPARGQVAYCSAKAALVGLVGVGALELGPRGIRVNAIAPGLVRTPATNAVWNVPGLLEGYESNTALGRSGEPRDIADAAVFLASDESRFITGTTLLVDGGAHHLSYPDTGEILRSGHGKQQGPRVDNFDTDVEKE